MTENDGDNLFVLISARGMASGADDDDDDCI